MIFGRIVLGWRLRLERQRGIRADAVAFLLGLASALALPPLHGLPVLVLVIPGLLVLLDAAERPSGAARIGWWFGFGHAIAGLYWITEAILFEAERYWWLVPVAVPALAAVMAVFIALPAWIAWHAPSGWRRICALAGAWVLFDIARQFVATGFPWNPLGSVWTMPGWAGDVMIQPAAWVGVHGLTLMTLLLAAAPRRGRMGWVVCLAGVVIWAGLGAVRLHAPTPPDQGVTAIVVQGNIPQGQKWSRERAGAIFHHYLELTAGAVRHLGDQPAVVVWPETASPFPLEIDTAAREAISAAAGDRPVLAGGVRFDRQARPRNSLFGLVAGGVTAAIYDKWHLVPFGEYQPEWIPIGIQLVPGGGFAAGPGARTVVVPGIPPFGALICYETIFPGQVVDAYNRPQWLVNVTNDAWFGNSSGPRQHLSSSRLRSVEEGLPLVRAANTGISVVFDARGHEFGRIGLNRTGTLAVALPAALPTTVFAGMGLWIPVGLSLLALILGMVTRRSRQN